MKTRASRARLGLGAGLILATVSLGSAPAADPAGAKATNASVEFKAPQSHFVLPSGPQEGRDPFYPRSLRPYVNGRIINTNAPALPVIAADLKLKALSGTTDRPLATINNVTFLAGEEAEVMTTNGRTRVRCVEIRHDSVIIQIGAERRELKMRM